MRNDLFIRDRETRQTGTPDRTSWPPSGPPERKPAAACAGNSCRYSCSNADSVSSAARSSLSEILASLGTRTRPSLNRQFRNSDRVTCISPPISGLHRLASLGRLLPSTLPASCYFPHSLSALQGTQVGKGGVNATFRTVLHRRVVRLRA